MVRPYHPDRPPQLPESAEFLRLSPEGYPLWLDSEFGQRGIVNIDLPSGEVRHATAAELRIVSDTQFPRQTTTSKEATVPKARKSPPARKSGGKSPSRSGGEGAVPNWKELEGAELGKYLLGHPTISDKLHTTKARRKGEGRESFIRRIYDLDES